MNAVSAYMKKVNEIYAMSETERAGGIKCAVSSEMANALLVWQDIYQNRAAWLEEDTKSLNLGVAIAREFARLVTLELKSEVTADDARGEYINSIYQPFLRKSVRRLTERAAALGGVCLKPFASNGKMTVDVVDPLDFFPAECDDDGRITAAAFLARKDIGTSRYTKIETHRFSEGTEYVKSLCYRAKNGTSGLGVPAELSEVPEWADIPKEFAVTGIDRPLFCYFRMPFENEIDRGSPLGVSAYSGAVELLRDADEQYTRLLWEFEGGELAVDADETALRTSENGRKGMPTHNRRVFRKLFRGIGTGKDDFYNVYAPQLRADSYISGLNTILRRIEFSASLAYGTLSDVSDVDKTAEEIRSSKQRSYAAVQDIQSGLEDTLRDLAYIIGVWGSIYGLCPAGGEPVMSFEWDDSIVADRAQEFTEKTQLVRDGIMQPWELRAWYFGEDEKTARAMTAFEELIEE